MKTIKSLIWLGLVLVLMNSRLQAQAQQPPEWLTPIAPFHIAGNIYYVGSQNLASYVVATARGNVLIKFSLEASLGGELTPARQLGE